jgi:integrase
MAAISVFCSYCHKNNPLLFAQGDPSKNITPLTLPPLEPRALTESQVRSLKSLCDRLPRLHQRQGRRVLARERREKIAAPTHAWARPYRDRAIVFLFLSTGLRREELVNLSWKHLDIGDRCTPEHLRQSRGMRLQGVRGKGKSMRTVFLSVDARQSLADYLEYEWYGDAGVGEDRALVLHEQPLFLSARGIPKRKIDGRLSLRAINFILNQIGRWHDADFGNKEQHISPLRPHDLRHTFAFMLAKVTQNDPYELQRRLGHRSQRYIERYTNPPEEVAAHYVEDF